MSGSTATYMEAVPNRQVVRCRDRGVAVNEVTAAEHIAPVIAWLLGPGARDVTGRVLEAGNGHISVPGTCQPGTPFPLPPLMSPAAADALLPRVLASATPPPALLTSLLDPAGA